MVCNDDQSCAQIDNTHEYIISWDTITHRDSHMFLSILRLTLPVTYSTNTQCLVDDRRD